MMKSRKIVCYGDSNTWGYVPVADYENVPAQMYPDDVRWVSVLGNLLGKGYEVVNEGLCGRTLAVEDPAMPHCCGIKTLGSILGTRDPADLFIIMLGTNDVFHPARLEAEVIAEHLGETVKFIRRKETRRFPVMKAPRVVVVCPPPVVLPEGQPMDEEWRHALLTSGKLGDHYRRVAEANGCEYLDAGKFISCCPIDGVHWSAESHQEFARAISNKILEMKL